MRDNAVNLGFRKTNFGFQLSMVELNFAEKKVLGSCGLVYKVKFNSAFELFKFSTFLNVLYLHALQMLSCKLHFLGS